MGQGLLAPPTVEGWHEGVEWVDSGALVERVNFAAKELGDPSKPGVKDIIKRLKKTYGNVLSAEQVVDGCLDLIGPLNVDKSTREGLVDFVYENNSETVLEDVLEDCTVGLHSRPYVQVDGHSRTFKQTCAKTCAGAFFATGHPGDSRIKTRHALDVR